MGDGFDTWLGTRLKELEADDVFIPYIRGLLVSNEVVDFRCVVMKPQLSILMKSCYIVQID